MITLSEVSDIAITIFSVIWVVNIIVGKFLSEKKGSKKYIFKKTRDKMMIDIYSMEASQYLMQQDWKGIGEEKVQKLNQLKDLEELLLAQKAELAKIEKQTGAEFYEPTKKKKGEIKETENTIETNKKETEQMTGVIQYLEKQIGELVKNMSIRQRMYDSAKDMCKKLL